LDARRVATSSAAKVLGDPRSGDMTWNRSLLSEARDNGRVRPSNRASTMLGLGWRLVSEIEDGGSNEGVGVYVFQAMVEVLSL
jgi:hypothetical protein